MEAVFADASRHGLLWELESACRNRALQRVAELTGKARKARFFLNVSPEVFSDVRCSEGLLARELALFGIETEQVVLEITEKTPILDDEHFARSIRRHREIGLNIALDDFGAGHSSLVTLMSCKPQFVKLDRAVVRDIHLSQYQQTLVRSLVSFAASAELHLIAEGVESWKEIETLIRLGIRYIQGFLLGRPEPDPREPDEATLARLNQIVRRFACGNADVDETIGAMVVRPRAFELRVISVEELDHLFRETPGLEHVVFIDNERPVGLVTRQHFYWITGGPYGYSLFRKKFAEEVCKSTLLVVAESVHISTLAKLAMEREPEDLYDPAIIVDAAGRFIGDVTMKQLITRSVELEVQTAQGANPLTGLPGNRAIHHWILGALTARTPFTLIYADLDRFKEYNDRYGFLAGDDMIRSTALLLEKFREQISDKARVGHVGGDDFVVFSPGILDESIANGICREFDFERLRFFASEDIATGSFSAVTRSGEKLDVPLVTLSLAVITSNQFESEIHIALLSQIAASLKKEAKLHSAACSRSSYLLERRYHSTRV